VSWNQISNSGSLITSYTVKWGTASGVYTNSATVAVVPKVYTITGLTSGTQYFWAVQANSFAGCSSVNSNEGTGTTTGAAPGCVNADTTVWVANVVANGDPAPSGTVQTAVCTFANAVSILKARTPYIGVIAPGSTAITLRTPLFPGPINNPPPLWSASVAGGDSVNGLTANAGANRFWGVQWGSDALSINNCGFSIYMPITAGVGAFLDFGGYDGTNGVYAGLNFTGATVVFTIGLAALQASIAYPGPGFFSFNRTASNVLKVYWGNSTNPIAQIGATVVGDNSLGAFPGGTAATQGYFLGAVNQAGIGAISQSNNTYSYLSMHDGYALADVQQEFAAVQAMRISDGGGSI
jgi:hypothetical protein